MDGINSPTRVLHGTTNAVMHLQSSLMETVPVNLKQVLLLWLDDVLLQAKTVNGLLAAIGDLFRFCAERNIKLNPSKVCYLRQPFAGAVAKFHPIASDMTLRG